jgi:hypothetical protein
VSEQQLDRAVLITRHNGFNDGRMFGVDIPRTIDVGPCDSSVPAVEIVQVIAKAQQ